MFSDSLQKIEWTSSRNLFLIAGGLVIICQLVAMGLVVDGQVKKAEARDSELSSQRSAIAQCLETSSGSGRSRCFAMVGRNDSSLGTPGQLAGTVQNFNSASPSSQSFMAVSYAR